MTSIREQYEHLGVTRYYQLHGAQYENPHQPIVHELLSHTTFGESVLDLCCGSGEVTRFLQATAPTTTVVGNDPYTYQTYIQHTGCECYTADFIAIAQGALNHLKVDTIVCSFALHLCPLSLLPTVLYQLSLISNRLIILTPHKKPEIPKTFWQQLDEQLIHKVRMRTYTTLKV